MDTTLTTTEREEYQRLEAVLAANADATFAFIRALGAIRDKRLYRGDYATFDEYLRDKHRKLSRQRVSQLLTHVSIVDEFCQQIVDSEPPDHEGQTRELARLPDLQLRQAAWAAAQVASGSNQPTASYVKAAVNVLNEALTTGGMVDIGNGEQMAFNAAITNEVFETMARQKQHIQEELGKRKVIMEVLMNSGGHVADMQRTVNRILSGLSPDSEVVIIIKRPDTAKEKE